MAYGMTYEKLSKILWTAGLDWTTDTIKVALLGSGYSPDLNAQEFWDDVNSNEITGTGYTAGGLTITGATIVDNDDGTVIIDCDDIEWTGATFTVNYAVVYKDTGSASTSPLIACIDLEGGVTITASPFSIQVPPTGLINSYTG